MTQSALRPLRLDIVSDVVCPWCYIGKKRIEDALAQVPDLPIVLRWRPFFLSPETPREGTSRADYLTAKFGSVERYREISRRVHDAAAEEGLPFHPERITRQPHTLDCHRLIHWASESDAGDKGPAMKSRLMEMYFVDGADLTDVAVLAQAAADVGLDRDDIARRLASDRDEALISAQAREASANGISGVPTFVFAERYAVSGAQSADHLVRALRSVSAELNGADA